MTVRYRRRPGSMPPLTDAVGHLLAVNPAVRVQTKTGAVIECAPADVVAVRTLTDAPVRTSEIRALEHAAAAARSGGQQTWLDGWLLRADPDAELEANSAVPLDISASTDSIPAIVRWYAKRGLTPRLAIPDRLLRVPASLTAERVERMLVRDVRRPDGSPERHASATLDDEGHASVTLGAQAGARAAVSDAPDGTRWVGLSEAGPSCEALLAWGARHGATRAYVRVADRDATAIALTESLGFRLHHRRSYFRLNL